MSVIIITPLGIPSTSLLFSHTTYLLRFPKPCVSTCQHLHLPSLPVPILLLMNYPKSVFYQCSRSHLFIPTQRDYPTNSQFPVYPLCRQFFCSKLPSFFSWITEIPPNQSPCFYSHFLESVLDTAARVLDHALFALKSCKSSSFL